MRNAAGMAATINILLADDSVDEHFLFLHTLRGIDCDVKISTALNGVELLRMLDDPAGSLPDLLFLDLNMPLKNGKEALAEIRKNPKLKQLPVIIYSTSDEKRDINDSLTLGADLYVRKPQDFVQLERSLSRILSLYRDKGSIRPPESAFVFPVEAD